MDRLKGKIAIVTGAGQGIGEAIVEEFLKEGAVVVAAGRTLSKCVNVCKKLENIGACIPVRCDITNREDVREMVEKCKKEFGPPDVLINNAGVASFYDPVSLTMEQWQECFKTDLDGAWNCAQEVLPYMLEKGKGDIINIASVHGHKIIPGCFPYPVAKHGLIGLTRALGLEYAEKNIRVNSISPGLIMTPLVENWLNTFEDPAAARKRQEVILPCHRIGESKEVAMTTVFLASDEARYINATDILIDGGRSMVYHERP